MSQIFGMLYFLFGLCFPCLLDYANDALAYILRYFTNPGIRCKSGAAVFVTSKMGTSIVEGLKT